MIEPGTSSTGVGNGKNRRRFWTDERVERFLLTAVASVLVGTFLSLLGPDRDRGAILRGDFPAFYAAAAIVRSGQGERLYDPELQAAIENESFPSLAGRYLAYAYPPYYAAVLEPLSAFAPLTAKLVYTILMLTLYFLALRGFSAMVPAFANHPWRSAAIAGLTAPALHGVLGGQNSALSLFLYALLARGVLAVTRKRSVDDSVGSALLAGWAVGMWFIKPHFAIIAGAPALLLLPRVATLVALFVTLVWWFIAAQVSGPSWPAVYLSALATFAAEDTAANAHQMVSLTGVTEAAAAWAGMVPTNPIRERLVIGSYLVSGAIFAAALLAAWSVRRSPSEARVSALLLALGPLVTLVSPHTLFYDLVMCLPAAARVWVPRTDRGVALVIGLLIALFVFATARPSLPLQPLVLIPAALLVQLLVSAARSGGGERPAPGPDRAFTFV